MGLKVALLTGSSKTKARRELHAALESGEIHILIGTHALIEDEVQFHNLGLAVIDEQHRFGVEQRSRLWKKNKLHPHVLVMTATPIPRTIYLALSSFKNISLMQTPPHGRQAIKTQVLPYSKKTIKKIINEELRRNGQIYFLHNRVESIEAKANEIKKLCKKTKIGLIHGRMPEKKLIKIMDGGISSIGNHFHLIYKGQYRYILK
jgi:transcription-repair coupling factor (superfamily II helicase)